MNRIIVWAAAVLAIADVLVTPAAAEFTSSYYQPASWQAAEVPTAPTVEPATPPSEPVRIGEEPAAPAENNYQEAFTEPAPVDAQSETNDWDKPVASVDDKDYYDSGYDSKKGGKGGCSTWCPCWTFSADLLVLKREHLDNVPLVVDDAGATLLDTDDIDFDSQAGLRLAAARQINCCNDIEFEFFFVDAWSYAADVTAAGAQGVVFGQPVAAAPFNWNYGNDLYSFELNWRRAWGYDRFQTLVGLRLMEMDENATLSLPGPVTAFGSDIDNHLIGFQIGAEGIIWRGCRWEIEGGCKVGIYHNAPDFSIEVPPAAGVAIGTAEHTAFASELWLGANYCLTDCLSLRAGWQGLWIEGVAVLPEQLDDPAILAAGGLDMGGSPFYHGLYCGAEMNW